MKQIVTIAAVLCTVTVLMSSCVHHNGIPRVQKHYPYRPKKFVTTPTTPVVEKAIARKA